MVNASAGGGIIRKMPACTWYLIALLTGGAALAGEIPAPREQPWRPSVQSRDPRTVDLYFFWSAKCPHCRRARPFVEGLAREHEWLRLHSYEIGASRANAEIFVARAAAVGETARSVPSFIFCKRMMVGYQDDTTSGAELLSALRACRDGAAEAVQPQPPPARRAAVEGIDPETGSLLAVTFMLAGLDAFNPCAFFVLLFLLSLMIRTASRVRLLVIGGIFVLSSGLVYFVFMAAWLNAFILFGGLAAVTTVAGLLAMVIGAFNAKDYFLAHTGPSLSMSDGHRSRLYARVRNLLDEGRLPALMVSAAVLAIAANSYELLCTAGFPMVYTRILTLRELPPALYYGYLALYNLVYVLPLLLIVIGFACTLGTRKLSEREGRILKLLSGLLMFALGAVLLLAPQLLQRLAVSVVIVAAALAATALLVKVKPPP